MSDSPDIAALIARILQLAEDEGASRVLHVKVRLGPRWAGQIADLHEAIHKVAAGTRLEGAHIELAPFATDAECASEEVYLELVDLAPRSVSS